MPDERDVAAEGVEIVAALGEMARAVPDGNNSSVIVDEGFGFHEIEPDTPIWATILRLARQLAEAQQERDGLRQQVEELETELSGARLPKK